MPNLTTNYKLKKPLYSEQADIQIINENMDLLDASAARKKDRILYLTESQEFTIPDGVYELDVYLVNGGEDGKAPTERSLENGWCGGGYGGAGGGCFFLPGLRVAPGDIYNVIVGAAGGGTTYFGSYGVDGLVTAGGTVGSSSNTRGDRTLRVGAFPMLYGQLNGGRCPLDGQIYGVSGAAGGVSYASQADNYTLTAGAGGDKAVVNAEECIPPQGGYDGNISYLEYGSAADNFAGGGGGGSFDNNGQAGKASTKAAGTYRAGAGANATTYGCGGGGGAGGFTTLMRGGAGGKGAQGVCIIAY